MLLDRLLASLRVEVAPFAVCEVLRGWRLRMPPDGHVGLHFVVRGQGRLLGTEGRSFALTEGTVFVTPPEQAVRVEPPATDDGDLSQAASCSLPEHGLLRMIDPDDEATLMLVCGAVRATYGGSIGLFSGLRQPLVVDFGPDPRVRGMFEGLLAEQADRGPGSATMMRALMTQGLVAVLRRLCDGGECSLPWLQALADDRLVRALDLMLESPEQPHTLESVARAAGMSRSAFSEHFSQTFGRTAMELLREIRLDRGAELLRTTDLTVGRVAERIGLSSRSYFSRAFRARFGIDPAGFRAANRDVATVAATAS